MPRLTASGLAAGDEAARAAAIAAMGYRLAAAGPRTRQRVMRRGHAPLPAAATTPLQLKSSAEADPLPRFLFSVGDAAADPSPPRRTAPGMVRTVAILGATAACGFALVLFAQGALLEKAPHGGQTVALAPSVIRQAEPRVETAAAIATPPPMMIAARPAPAVEVPAFAPSAPERHAYPASEKPQTRLAAHPAKPAGTHHPVVLAALIVPPASHTRPAEARHARIELPRWLTEDHPTPERGLVMSEPPHDLALPQRLAQTPPQPAEQRLPIVVASSAEPQLPPLREPGYRPY